MATKDVDKRNMGEWSWNLNTFLFIPAHRLYWINHSSLTAFRTITKARGILLGPRPEELENVENSTARSHGFAPVCTPTFPHNLNDAKLVCGLSQQMERHLRLSPVITMPTRGPSPQDTDSTPVLWLVSKCYPHRNSAVAGRRLCPTHRCGVN